MAAARPSRCDPSPLGRGQGEGRDRPLDPHPDPLPPAGEEIRAKALELGFHAVGFAPAALGPEARERLRAFLAAGQHGEMGWLADRAEQRAHPRALWPEARSVIALGLSYAPDDDPLAALARPDRGNISVYARNRDYHDVVKGMLKHLGRVHRQPLRRRR